MNRPGGCLQRHIHRAPASQQPRALLCSNKHPHCAKLVPTLVPTDQLFCVRAQRTLHPSCISPALPTRLCCSPGARTTATGPPPAAPARWSWGWCTPASEGVAASERRSRPSGKRSTVHQGTTAACARSDGQGQVLRHPSILHAAEGTRCWPHRMPTLTTKSITSDTHQSTPLHNAPAGAGARCWPALSARTRRMAGRPWWSRAPPPPASDTFPTGIAALQGRVGARRGTWHMQRARTQPAAQQQVDRGCIKLGK